MSLKTFAVMGLMETVMGGAMRALRSVPVRPHYRVAALKGCFAATACSGHPDVIRSPHQLPSAVMASTMTVMGSSTREPVAPPVF